MILELIIVASADYATLNEAAKIVTFSVVFILSPEIFGQKIGLFWHVFRSHKKSHIS